MELKTLSGLLSLPGITWVSLQKGVAGGQLAAMQEKAHIWDACSCDHDLAEAAAVVSTLDLVITTDTCIAHLAGAMARPVWVLLPHLADWRWMQQVKNSPWYPTARLIRQELPGDWEGVLDRVAGMLVRLQQARDLQNLDGKHRLFP